MQKDYSLKALFQPTEFVLIWFVLWELTVIVHLTNHNVEYIKSDYCHEGTGQGKYWNKDNNICKQFNHITSSDI